VTADGLRSQARYNGSMPAPRLALRRLLTLPDEAAGRRLAIAGVAGILLSAPVSLEHALAHLPQVGWLLTAVGAVLAILCLRPAWIPQPLVTRMAIFVCVAFCAASTVVAGSLTVIALSQTEQQLLCVNDVAPDTIVAGQEVIHGANPYTSFNLLDAERALGCPFFSVSPQRAGIFAASLTEPSLAQVQAAAEATIHGHPTGGLLLKFAYPAGTALLGVLGGRALVLIGPIAVLLAGLVIVRRAEPPMRRVTLLALGAQTGLLGLVGSPFVDLIAVALLMIAITTRGGPATGVSLGVACAVKQTVWFVAPALLVLALRDGRARDVRYHAGALLGFTVINVPFMVASPSAWFVAVLSPGIKPAFPLGVGPGAAGQAGSATTTMFLVLMIAAVVGGAAICAFAAPRWASAGIIVSSLGLWIGPRSLGDYVALLGVIAVCTVAASTSMRSAPPGDPRLSQRDTKTISELVSVKDHPSG